MPNAFAIFDTLYIVRNAEKQYDSLSLMEVNFLSYFACSLSLYKGMPVAIWNYRFMRNEQGAPVSAELAESCSLLLASGEMKKAGTCYQITEEGEQRLSFLCGQSLFKWRKEYLQTACDCLLTESIIEILAAISKDAVIRESSVHSMKYLNRDDNSAISRLHQQFGLVKKAIGERKNLFVPAVSWLQYLKQELNKHEA